MNHCPHCGSKQLVKAGRRSLSSGATRQLFRCNDCQRRFSTAMRHGKRTEGKAILRALVLVCRGCSYEEASHALEREFGVARSKATISRWLAERTLPYLEIRDAISVQSGPLVRSYLFTHAQINYRYQVHCGKLLFAKAFPRLVRYLLTLPNWLDHSLFSSAQRCSRLACVMNPGLAHARGTRLSRMAAEAEPLATTSHQRHAVVEDYLLNGDRDTIAVEVPVYFRHPEFGLTAGHIDLVQVSNRGIQILDYKPQAARENPGQVVAQLSVYAQALARRARLPIEVIRCGYFDGVDAYFFRPASCAPASTRRTMVHRTERNESQLTKRNAVRRGDGVAQTAVAAST